MIEVFKAFLILGLTSFGGPVAHLGYFREEFVVKRKWLTDAEYADTVALCQFLPGPASSQVGMALGWRRAGLPGMLAAFVAFTAPSAIALGVAAWAIATAGSSIDLTAPIAGLKAAAVAVVAIALWGMAKNLTTTRVTTAIALLALAVVLLAPAGMGVWAQIAAIVVGGLVGWLTIRGDRSDRSDRSDEGNEKVVVDESSVRTIPYSLPRWAQALAATVFVVGLLGAMTWWAGTWNGIAAGWDTYFRAGALVFGGGHVVLPLLESGLVPEHLDADHFLAGYGLAQAVPGPLFTFASYLGVSTNGALGSLIATLAIFLPSMLLLLAVLPLWSKVAALSSARGMVAGANAAVVGILGAAFYDPVWTHGVVSPGTFVVTCLALVALTKFKVPAWAVVLGAGALGRIVF
ncbi:chromate efflux transporter [Corynebacterium sp. H113]|uniref:chromate efflux transporter n=1 Tax=Corynebacterium sp. H113 TaxID=3133419 RepID=UPI0030B62F9B